MKEDSNTDKCLWLLLDKLIETSGATNKNNEDLVKSINVLVDYTDLLNERLTKLEGKLK